MSPVVFLNISRICGLENKLIGASGRSPTSVPLSETLALGHVMFEMCAGTDTDFSLLPDLQANYPQVSFTIIFLISFTFLKDLIHTISSQAKINSHTYYRQFNELMVDVNKIYVCSINNPIFCSTLF